MSDGKSITNRPSPDDLPTRLRAWTEVERIEARPILDYDLIEAADRIEAQAAENELLRDGVDEASYLRGQSALAELLMAELRRHVLDLEIVDD